MRLAVLVPVKRFDAAKGRLAAVLPDLDRARLARWLATRVLAVVADLPTFVACDNDEVATWAEANRAEIVWGEGLGLDGAVDDGIAKITGHGFDQILVTHADLARPGSLLSVARRGFITVVPDRRRDGTNVMSFPTATPLRAAYGGGSFSRHLDQAVTIGEARANSGAEPRVGVEVRADPQLALDVDTREDLAHPLIQEVLPTWLRTIPVSPPST